MGEFLIAMISWARIESPYLRSRLIMQESLLLEREAKEEARKAQAEAEASNKELLKKAEDSDRKVEQLQELVQRLV